MKTHCPIITKFRPSGKRRSYTWCLWRNDDGSFCNNDCWTRKEIESSRCSRHLNRTKRKKEEREMTKESNTQEKNELAQIQEIVEQAQDQFQLMDMMDEAQILDNIGARVNQRIASALTYYEKQSRQDVLTKKGIDECINKLSELGYVFREELVSFSPCPSDKEYFVFIAKVFLGKRDRYGNVHELRTTTGIKRQWMFYKNRSQGVTPDEFWFEKGSQKAIRNANRILISESLKQNLIENAKSVKNGRMPIPPQPTPQPRPTTAIPQQPRATRSLPQPQPQVPQTSYEEIEKELRADTKWMLEQMPWLIEADSEKQKRKCSWQDLFDISTIKNKEGKDCSCRQYLRSVASACKKDSPLVSAKATITADLIKKQEEDLENLSSPDSLFPEKEEQHQYSGEGVGA